MNDTEKALRIENERLREVKDTADKVIETLMDKCGLLEVQLRSLAKFIQGLTEAMIKGNPELAENENVQFALKVCRDIENVNS